MNTDQQKQRIPVPYLFVLFLALLLLGAGAARAQVTTSSIVGTVSDSTGALVPDANVTVTDIDRNQTKTTVSNSAGEFRIDFLLVGNYSVSVSANGFKKFVEGGITLNAGDPFTVKVELVTGATTESVEVTSAVPLVNTTNAEVGTTVSQHEMTELPIVNRNPYTLLDLTPGVQNNQNTQSFGAPVQQTNINGGSLNNQGSTNYYLDGVSNMNSLNNGGGILPNPDALQEFRVQTSNYGAPYGRYPSGIVNAIVRSGTNQVHGSVFEFLRNPHLNARPWNSSPTLAKEPLHRNQFGATAGGPIIRNKTFFFGSYDGLRQADATFLTGAIVPSALERSGNFTQSIGTRPKDPLTGTNFVCNGVVDVICPNRLDAVAAKLLAYVPSANTTTSTPSGTAPGWAGYAPTPLVQDSFLLKVNHTLTSKHSLAATYFMSAGNTSAIAASNTTALIAPYSNLVQTWRQQNAILNENWIVSNAIVNNIWGSYTRLRNGRTDTPGLSLADFGSAYALQGPAALPNIGVTGFFNMRNLNAGPAASDDYALRDLVTWSLGKHTLQFGGEALLDKAAKYANLNNYGQITFTGVITKNALADYLLGIPSSFEQDIPSTARTASFTFSGFFQDDYRVAPRLTLNLGLRYDLQTPPVEAADHNTTFIAGEQSTRFPATPKGIVFPGDPGVPRGITPMRIAHVSPRLGFAFDPTGSAQTSIRGGVGIFWGSVSEESWAAGANTSPFGLQYNLPNVSNINGATLTNPYRGGTNPFPYTGTFYPAGASVRGTLQNSDWPYTIQTNLSIQQQISNALSLNIAYVGAFAKNIALGEDANYPTLNTNYGAAAGIASCGVTATITATVSNSQCRRPIEPIGSLLLSRSNEHGSFNSLQVSVTQRLTHHLSANGFYTWSKSLSSAPADTNTPIGPIQDYNNLHAERGRTAFDQRNQAVIAIIYQSEFAMHNRLARAVANGWEIAPLARLHSGLPFTILNGVDANLDGTNTSDRAQVIGDPFSGGHSIGKWFNTAAFAQNPAVAGNPVDGNSPNYYVTGPSFRSVDLTLARTFPIHNQINLQFRAEASNALNMVSYTNPGNTVNSATFGVITGANAARQIQVGLKLAY